MTLQKFSLSASTLCATGTLLVLGGFLAVNLAGCGGGGGGTSVVRPTTIPFSGAVRLLNSSGTEVTSGTVTLTPAGGGAAIVLRLAPGGFSIANVPSGNYNAAVNLGQGVVSTGVTVSTSGITVTDPLSAPSFSFNNNQSATDTRSLLVFGRVLRNPGDSPSFACDANATEIADSFVIQVRDVSVATQPVIARVLRAASTNGTYGLALPYRPNTFRVEVTNIISGTVTTSPIRYAGQSAVLNIIANEAEARNVDICTNTQADANAPDPLPPARDVVPTPFVPGGIPPLPSGTAGAIIATATARVEATLGARATATAQAEATAQSRANATATAVANVTATAQSRADATATSVAVATATANAGATATSAAATAAPTPTPTP